MQNADPHIITFGCRLNLYESEVIRAHLNAAGIETAVVINSCAVTGEAERQVRQTIRKARREHPTAKIIVTGCAAHIAPEKYAAMDEVDLVLDNTQKLQAESYQTSFAPNSLAAPDSSPASFRQKPESSPAHPLVTSFDGGLTRGFVPVQYGCNHACTYCIVPQSRGPSRNLPFTMIVAQTRALVLKAGYPEIALTGVDIASYDGEGRTLGGLVRDLLAAVPELKRLRLSSLDPAAMDDILWGLIAHEPRLMPHLHLSLQAGDDMILKRMKRRHSRQQVIDLIARARALRPDMAFGADLIAGFPTETDEMFENTRALVEQTGLTGLHVFPYSARLGTPAAKMPQVPMPVRKARAQILRDIGQKAMQSHIDGLRGQRLELHVEQPFLARTPCFTEVALDSAQQVGAVIYGEMTGRDGLRATAKRIEE